MIPPDPLPPSPSTFAHLKTPVPQPPNLSASRTEAEQNPNDRKGPMMALNQQL